MSQKLSETAFSRENYHYHRRTSMNKFRNIHFTKVISELSFSPLLNCALSLPALTTKSGEEHLGFCCKGVDEPSSPPLSSFGRALFLSPSSSAELRLLFPAPEDFPEEDTALRSSDLTGDVSSGDVISGDVIGGENRNGRGRGRLVGR